MCTRGLNLTLPTVVDGMENAVARAYAAFPDRIYIVDGEGRVAYKGRLGPSGFDVGEARSALGRLVGPESPQ